MRTTREGDGIPIHPARICHALSLHMIDATTDIEALAPTAVT